MNKLAGHRATLEEEAGVNVLDWLDAHIVRWDLYVDLKQQNIRYCFRDLADASTFTRLFSQRRAG